MVTTDPWGGARASQARRLVVIDTDESLARQLPRLFRTPEWVVEVLTGEYDALPFAPADAFIIDVCPEGRPRVDMIEKARRAVPSSKVVAVTAYPSLRLAVDATKAGATDCLLKPLGSPALLAALSEAGDLDAWSERRASLPSLARIEWEYIAMVLETTGGNISVAARTLGIERSTLHRKFKKYPPQR